MFECIFRSVLGVKRVGMQKKGEITSYFRFAQRQRLPALTARALASNARGGPRTCQGGLLESLPIAFTGD